MTTARRTVLSEIMSAAWTWRRAIGCTMAEALRTAWRRWKADQRGFVRIVTLRSPIKSPTTNRLAVGPYARTRDWEAGRMIARFGY